jgi:vacuolar protein-sorting-associated protein 4
MSNQEFLNRAIGTVQKAIASDNALEYEKAYQQYCDAREFTYTMEP